jgi:zinc ribbon protein
LTKTSACSPITLFVVSKTLDQVRRAQLASLPFATLAGGCRCARRLSSRTIEIRHRSELGLVLPPWCAFSQTWILRERCDAWGHSHLLWVVAVDRVFAQLAALLAFNGTLQGSQARYIPKGLWEPLQMERCQQCGSEVERAAPFCSQCGSPLRKSSAASSGADTLTTVASADALAYRPPQKTSSFRPASHLSRGEKRFAPGILIAERYRIISLLGRGGMGDVFRADDLTVGQPVALKFLPESMVDRSMLERFRNEVASQAASRILTFVTCMTSVRLTTRCSCPWSTCKAKTSRRCCGVLAGSPAMKLWRSRARFVPG